jgi:magnesium chelatase family protein
MLSKPGIPDFTQFGVVTYTTLLRVARTIADLAGATTVSRIHVAEALGYRRQPPRA